jgi:hypothetical protein
MSKTTHTSYYKNKYLLLEIQNYYFIWKIGYRQCLQSTFYVEQKAQVINKLCYSVQKKDEKWHMKVITWEKSGFNKYIIAINMES